MSRVARLAVLGALGLAACATFALRRPPAHAQDVIRLSHAVHQAAAVECVACHANAAGASALEGRLLPEERVCLRCHAGWKSEGRCDRCHLDQPGPWPAHEPRVRLSHRDHLPRVGGDCRRCHPLTSEPGRPVDPAAPMGTCLGCHPHQAEYDDARCDRCHVDLSRLPLRPLAYFSHQGDFLKTHRFAARTSSSACTQCHDPGHCAECHARTTPSPVDWVSPERVERESIHRGDFVSRHVLEARADPAMCARCHSSRHCDDCHRASRIHPSTGPGGRTPHPAGWGQDHGLAARRDIGSCAGCHDQGAASNCVACHKVGGIGGPPHPPSFLRNHTRGDIAKNRTCLTCHP